MSIWMNSAVLGQPLWMWACFLAVVLVLMVLDLGFLNRHDREISARQSLRQSGFYISIGLLFGGFVYWEMGAQAAEQYYTGFIIEKTLSMDNIFVISLIFSYFRIPREYQYRVLFWGILGVILLRGILIGVGAELVERFEWVLYLFAAFLVYTGVKMLRGGDGEHDIGHNPVIRFVRKYIRVTDVLHGNKFFVTQTDANNGKKAKFATPLLMALITVEFVDVIFALDSVPAIFAITTDAYIVYTSNIFAILGLRALYFALAALLHRFDYLKYSLSAVLIFIGGKVFAPVVGLGKVSSSISLAVTIALLGMGVIYSLHKTKKT